MERIRRFFRRLGKGLKAKGYTLVEVAAVVAVTGALTAVVVPVAVDKVKEGKITAAAQDVKQIGAAISGFYKDVGEWPSHQLNVAPTQGTRNYVVILKSGDSDNDNPGEKSGINQSWGFATPASPFGNTAFLEPYLVTDFTASNASYVYNKYNWRGPYIDSLAKKRDPWGHNYLVHVNAMQKLSGPEGSAELGTTKLYGWIISAGPDGKLDTGVRDSNIQGDDIGISLFSLHAKK